MRHTLPGRWRISGFADECDPAWDPLRFRFPTVGATKLHVAKLSGLGADEPAW
jgi:hypothetical protein